MTTAPEGRLSQRGISAAADHERTGEDNGVKIKVTSSGTPPPQAAASFARLLAAAMAKKPELRVVEKKDKAAQRLNSQAGGFIARPVE